MGEKLTGSALILVGSVNLLSGIALTYLLITLSGQTLDLLGAVLYMLSGEMPSFTTYIVAGWAFSILQLITGLVALAAGTTFLTKRSFFSRKGKTSSTKIQKEQ